MENRNRWAASLTNGAIWKGLLLFFLPILGGNLFQQIHTTADAIIVGQFVGKQGLAAIDAVHTLIKLPVNFFVGLSTGATILISQLYGAGNKEGISRAAHNGVWLALAGGLLLSVVGIVAAPYCITLLAVPSELYPMSLAYVRVYFGSMAVSMVYNIGAGMLRAMGDSKTPFTYLVIAGFVNNAFDFLFVGLFGWGVTGAALGTVVSQLLSAVLVLRALARSESPCRITAKGIKLHTAEMKAVFKVGLPVGLQSCLYPVSNMVIQTGINATGTNNIAAWALCGKLDFLVWMIADSLAAAIATFSAQNYGAGQINRLRKGVRVGTAMTAGAVMLASVALYLWCEPLSTLFLRAEDYDVIPIASELTRFLAPVYVLYVIGETLSGAICGTGETMRPMIITLLCTCLFRVLWLTLLVPSSPSMQLIITSYPASWLLASICFIMYYSKRLKRIGRSPSFE